MDPSHVHPDLRPIYRWLPRQPNLANPRTLRVVRALTPLARPARLREGVGRERVELRGGGSVRVFTPRGGGSGAALLSIHGGGLVLGSAVQEDAANIGLSAELDIVVVAVEYRLAPQHPFPAALDDCVQAWHWLQHTARARGIDPARVAVGGVSAGGGLAASLAARLHDEEGTAPAAQWLFAPMLDDRTAAYPDLDRLDHLLWDNRANRFGWSAYLGGPPGAEEIPRYAAPARRADLTGLPPAWIGVGDIDLFHDEDRDYAERLRAAGVDCTLDVVPGAPHGFESIAPKRPVSRAYIGRARDWLRHRLDLGPA